VALVDRAEREQYEFATGARPEASLSSSRSMRERRKPMTDSVYKIIELVGTSPKSWEDAASAAVSRAASSLRDLRIAEVLKLDLQLKDGKVEAYRAKISVSFKYEDQV
jgi:dodecin